MLIQGIMTMSSDMRPEEAEEVAKIFIWGKLRIY